MSSEPARKAEAGKPAWRYERRCPERTRLYPLVATHHLRFIELSADQGWSLLVDEVLLLLPMRQWMLSFPFQLRFLFATRL